HRLVRPEMPGQIHVAPEHSAARAVNKIKRETRTFGLNFHQRRSGNRAVFLDFLAQDCGQLLDGLRLENRGELQLAAKLFFNLRNHTNREQRMSAEFEKFILNADRMNSEN